MNPLFKPKLIAGNSNHPLAQSIARRISIHRGEPVELVKTRVERFNDQEIFVEVYENVRGEDMFIIQSTSNPANDNLMELLIMCDALRRSSAARITAVMPYFGYARQDRRSKARTPISAKLVANLLTVAGMFLLAWQAFEYVQKVAMRGRVTPSMQIPLWTTYVSVVVGLTLAGLQFVLAAWANLADRTAVWISLRETDDYEDPELADLLAHHVAADDPSEPNAGA